MRAMIPQRPQQPSRRMSGFTLPEVLLSSALAAVLLTALAHSTMQFGYTIAHLEQKAGIADAQDAVLRRLTREIREAWWVDVVSDQHIKLADVDGNFTEYYLDGEELMIKRPNGDVGSIFKNVELLAFVASNAARKREGGAEMLDSTWYVQAEPISPAFALESGEGSSLALSLAPPVSGSAIGASASEQVLSTEADVINLTVAFVPAVGPVPGDLTLSLFEARGPGAGHPVGQPIASMTVPGSSLPQAVMGEFAYQVPATSVALSLASAAALDPGRGYALVLSASEGASFVVPAHPVLPSATKDLLGMQSGPGSAWVELAMISPFSVSGAAVVSSTESQEMVATISVSLQQSNRPEQTRSASVLSQTLGDSPWLGVVPGEGAP